MKIVVLVARILLGLVFVVFGLDKIIHIFPVPPQPPGVLGEFMHSMTVTHYMMVVGVFEFVGGLLLIIGRFIPFALCLLAPIIVNILIVDVLVIGVGAMPSGFVIGLIVALLWLLIFNRQRSAFAGIFRAKA